MHLEEVHPFQVGKGDTEQCAVSVAGEAPTTNVDEVQAGSRRRPLRQHARALTRHNHFSQRGWAREVYQVMDRTSREWSAPRKAATVAFLLAASAGLCSPAYAGATTLTSAVRSADGTNLSGNPYFPLIVGASWTYKESGGLGGLATSSTSTNSVLSAQKTTAGEVVTMQFSSKVAGAKLATPVTSQYIIGNNGTIKVQSASSSSQSSFSSTYFVPSAAQVTTCAPCTFTGALTISVSGSKLSGHLNETATSEGARGVTVPAGKYTAEEVHLVIKVAASGGGKTINDATNFNLYLVKNIGEVESANNSIVLTIAGHSITEPIPSEALLSYKA